ncbi:Mv-ORF124 peptide [Maruca vitrata nucleopolyhedrovirus]|uniref:Mv-ORF124 peptide n=1 Tax=Maruca vitrata nucleopolyhedrovirus TaxID=1307954 RepID=A1YRI6_9ABAC|nr:Mv-ORF124 peptide [Maruca vitrata nucleopolyhedrovirus]ABM05440.1 Mv-ORF124 peptide [Maruca vitrata nucleopolyhedrovirus]
MKLTYKITGLLKYALRLTREYKKTSFPIARYLCTACGSCFHPLDVFGETEEGVI